MRRDKVDQGPFAIPTTDPTEYLRTLLEQSVSTAYRLVYGESDFFFTYTGTYQTVRIPDGALAVVVSGCGGGGGGGAYSGGAPSQPAAGEASILYFDGHLMCTLNGGAAGRTNTITWTAAGGSAVFNSASPETPYGLTRQIVVNRRSPLLGSDAFITGTSSIDSYLAGYSQFSGYGTGGNGYPGAAAGGAGAGSVDALVLPIRDVSFISFYVGKGGVQGVGDISGSPGLNGFMAFEFISRVI